MNCLRIVTINTAKGDGDYACRLELLANGLRELNPDVVLLQEALATDDGTHDTIRSLADELGMQSACAPARQKIRMVEGEWLPCSSGLGALSSLPILGSERLALPRASEDGERIAQLLAIDWDGSTVMTVNIHLSHLRGRDDLRRDQMRELFNHPWFGRDWSVRIVAGDLNTPLDDLPELLDFENGWDWRDCYAAGSGSEQRATIPVDAPAGVGRCIDFIVSLARQPAAHPTVRNAVVVLANPCDGVYPSDHRGVMVELLAPEVS